MRITLVTPSFNQAPFLEETIESVLGQGYPELEYIVMDGGSTDGSREILTRYSRYLSYWQSAPDRGQSDALRQGFARATGEVLNWLNSDDILAPGALSHIADAMRRKPDLDIYAAATENFVGSVRSSLRTKSIPANIDIESLLCRSGRTAARHQPGIYFRRAIYEAVGGIDASYHYCMDLDLYLRMLEHGARVGYDDRTVAFFRIHASSKTHGVSPHVLATVGEHIRSTDAVARRLGISANHRPHVRTLLGGVREAARRRQWREARGCLRLAAKIGGPTGMAREAGAAVRRALVRTPVENSYRRAAIH